MAERLLNITGAQALDDYLQQLPAKVERNVLRGALRAGALVVLPAAKANIHQISGDLARSLRVRTGAKAGRVRAVVQSKNFEAPFVEFGTRAHTITAKGRKSLSVGGLFFQSVDHPGARPHPFMRPALDANAAAAVVAAAEYIKTRLAVKNGLDTADVQIGVDEA